MLRSIKTLEMLHFDDFHWLSKLVYSIIIIIVIWTEICHSHNSIELQNHSIIHNNHIFIPCMCYSDTSSLLPLCTLEDWIWLLWLTPRKKRFSLVLNLVKFHTRYLYLFNTDTKRQ